MRLGGGKEKKDEPPLFLCYKIILLIKIHLCESPP